MRYEQRDIVLIPFPYSDLTGTKQKPALIVSNGKLNNSQDRICVLITSVKTNKGIKIEKIDVEGELPFESFVKPYRLFTISENKIKKKLTTITNDFHKRVIENLNEY